MTRLRPYLFVLTLFTLAMPVAARAAETVAAAGDASISVDARAEIWTLSAAGASLSLAMSASRDFEVSSLTSSAGHAWADAGPGTSVRVNGQTLPFGRRSAGFSFQGTSLRTHGSTLQLDAAFDLATTGLRVVRHFSITSGTPSFEVWTTYQATGGPVSVTDLNALAFTVRYGDITWLTGLQGDSAAVVQDSAFTLQRASLQNGDHLTLGAVGRSSEQAVPWIAVDRDGEEFYAALMWSGAWSLTASRTADSLALDIGLASMTTNVTAQPVDGPHAIFGATPGSLRSGSAALRSYVLDSIRGGAPLTPLVTYNTWFAYGVAIDDQTIRNEMEKAAALGTELFVMDAGWYTGAGADGVSDFDSGLGTWEPDPERFPDGLRPLADFAHSLGMRFGIWVEPERIHRLSMAGTDFDERWLATNRGSYGSEQMGQVCLASAAARKWILDKLTTFIDEVQPDYLKWDNNLWINCDREGHGHGSADGNFAHVNGLYDILATLRARYPNLLVENVSGGGNRIDFGMLRFTDLAWMDDRTAPSVHVRHIIEGLSAVFPPAYLLSFVTEHYAEPLHDAPDMSLYFRSRMTAALGLCFRSDDLAEGDTVSITREIQIYKTMRQALSVASATLLSPQAAVDGGPSWDILQETAADTGELLLHAFQSDAGVGTVNVKPAGLDENTIYEVHSVDVGLLGEATGAELMTSGIDIVGSATTAAHLLKVVAK